MATPSNPPPPPPPSTVARRGASRGFREVSSRYLSTPLHPSPSPRPSPRPSSANPSPRRTPSRSGSDYGSESESESTDENRRPTPLPQSKSVSQPFYFTSLAKPPNKRVVHKLFDEKSDADSRAPQESKRLPRPEHSRRRPRPGTPISSPKVQNPVRTKRAPASPRPARSEDDCGSDIETCSVDSCSSGTQSGSFCSSPPVTGTSMRNRSGTVTDVRSSFSRVESSGQVSNPLVYRSLNSSLSGSQATGVVLGKPPQPLGIRGALDMKKIKKGKRAEEEAHSLKLLNNRLIQLQFMNARAEVATKTRMHMMEKELYGASVGISELRERVNEQQILLDCLKREKRLNSILESQMMCLDDWDAVQKDQDESLSGVITALQNASIRVPVGSDVKADVIEIKEALSRAIKALEPSSSFIKKFVPMADEAEKIALDLAKVVAKEREYMEECGNLLAVAHNLQVKESSLRSTLIQFKQHSLPAQ